MSNSSIKITSLEHDSRINFSDEQIKVIGIEPIDFIPVSGEYSLSFEMDRVKQDLISALGVPESLLYPVIENVPLTDYSKRNTVMNKILEQTVYTAIAIGTFGRKHKTRKNRVVKKWVNRCKKMYDYDLAVKDVILGGEPVDFVGGVVCEQL